MKNLFSRLNGYAGINGSYIESICIILSGIQIKFSNGAFINYYGKLTVLDNKLKELTIYDPKDMRSPLIVNQLIGSEIQSMRVISEEKLAIISISGDEIGFYSSLSEDFETWILTEQNGKVYNIF